MNTTAQLEKSAIQKRQDEIAMLNDQFRITGIGGKIVLTRGVANLGQEMIANIVNAMRTYSAWSPDNDPYGEHDFGIITLETCQKVFFKIDYYDRQLKFGSDDPADPEKTARVLTVMLAEEY